MTLSGLKLHPDDVLLFTEMVGIARRVAKSYELKLGNVIATPDPRYSKAALGTCSYSGTIALTMRGMHEDGSWDETPRGREEVLDTIAHELAHLAHMNHGTAFQEFEEEMQEAVRNQTEDHREKVLRRLVKMQAVRDGEAKLGNAEAAHAFATAINRMMLEYELHPSDLDYQRAMQDDPVIEVAYRADAHGGKRKWRRSAWRESLASVVAKANLCTYLIQTSSDNIWFVGTRSHATVAEYTYATLVREADRLADREYSKFYQQVYEEGTAYRAKGFRAAWLDAFVSRVRERLEEERKQVVAEAAANVPGGQAMALMRIDNALIKARDYVDQKFSRKRNYASHLNGGRSYHQEGRAWGRAAADRIVLGRRGVGAGANIRSIGAGNLS
jgi:hypothetical protein